LVDDDLQRVEDAMSRRLAIEVLAHAVLEQRDLTTFTRLATPMRSQNARTASGVIAATPHAAQRRHARVVPAGDVLLLDHAAQLALAHDRVAQVEPGELDLLRVG
jgi:hypothetical protein